MRREEDKGGKMRRRGDGGGEMRRGKEEIGRAHV